MKGNGRVERGGVYQKGIMYPSSTTEHSQVSSVMVRQCPAKCLILPPTGNDGAGTAGSVPKRQERFGRGVAVVFTTATSSITPSLRGLPR